MAIESQYLKDSFRGTELDTTKWGTFSAGDTSYRIANGALLLYHNPEGGSSQYYVISTATTWDLNNSYIRVELRNPPRRLTNGQGILRIREEGGSGAIAFYYEYDRLHCIWTDAGGNIDYIGDAGNYDPLLQKFIQIREEAGVLYWETSPDAKNWEIKKSTAHTLSLNNIRIDLVAETYKAEDRPGIVAFSNLNYEPPVILPNRKTTIQTGIDNELIDKFTGYSEMPTFESGNNMVKIHCFDELETISQYKLSGGTLLEDIRTDLYIGLVLDEVYSNYYSEIATADNDETWNNFDSADTANFSFDTTNYTNGVSSRKIEVTNGYGATYKTINADLTQFDSIAFNVFVENREGLLSSRIWFGKSDSSEGYSYDLTLHLVEGWNFFKVIKSAFGILTSEPDWANIQDVVFLVETDGDVQVNANIDNIRLVDNTLYPLRVFDTGLNIIPVAWFVGNTALFEIKEASEAEGGRFFASEKGELIYQNRQHYNINSSFKRSRHFFNFNNSEDLIYDGKLSEVINTVIVSIILRRIQSETQIWFYASTPKQIPANETITVWAEFTDPVPVTSSGLVTPVSTTDYLANEQEDGGGANRTSDVSISITKFSTASKLEISNTSGTNLYLTFLQLRGTPATEQPEIRINSDDPESINKYGIQPSGGYRVKNKYLNEESYAQLLADQLVEWYGTPQSRIIVTGRSIPHLQISDMVTVRHPQATNDFIIRIVKIKETIDSGGYNASYETRPVIGFELLNFFTIGVSAIEGENVISY